MYVSIISTDALWVNVFFFIYNSSKKRFGLIYFWLFWWKGGGGGRGYYVSFVYLLERSKRVIYIEEKYIKESLHSMPFFGGAGFFPDRMATVIRSRRIIWRPKSILFLCCFCLQLNSRFCIRSWTDRPLIRHASIFVIFVTILIIYFINDSMLAFHWSASISRRILFIKPGRISKCWIKLIY